MKEKLILLGTNEYQNPLILRAKELGYETHVYGWPVGEIGERTADVYHPIDILDFDALWADCKVLNACGVAMITSEPGMHAQHFLMRKMGIPCNSEWTERVTTNKYLMRCVFRDGGLDNPKFILIDEKWALEEVLNEVGSFHFPIILKPIDSSSSRGVIKVDEKTRIKDAISYAMSWSPGKKVILEEYVDGQEYSGESIAYKGEYKLLAVTEKRTTGAPHFVETGHKQPASISKETYEKIESTLYKAFSLLHIEYGAIHPEFRITPEGKVVFMEIATRMGGDCIGSDLVPLSTGYDYMGMVISIGCGKAPSFEKIRKPMVAENHYIMTTDDLKVFEEIKTIHPEWIWRQSDFSPISDKPVLKSADRAGYYITVRKP